MAAHKVKIEKETTVLLKKKGTSYYTNIKINLPRMKQNLDCLVPVLQSSCKLLRLYSDEEILSQSLSPVNTK